MKALSINSVLFLAIAGLLLALRGSGDDRWTLGFWAAPLSEQSTMPPEMELRDSTDSEEPMPFVMRYRDYPPANRPRTYMKLFDFHGLSKRHAEAAYRRQLAGPSGHIDPGRVIDVDEAPPPAEGKQFVIPLD